MKAFDAPSRRKQWIVTAGFLGSILFVVVQGALVRTPPELQALTHSIDAKPGLSGSVAEVATRGGRGVREHKRLEITTHVEPALLDDQPRLATLYAEITAEAHERYAGFSQLCAVDVRFTTGNPRVRYHVPGQRLQGQSIADAVNMCFKPSA